MMLPPGVSRRSRAHRRIAAATAAILAVGVGLAPVTASAQPTAADRSVAEPATAAPLAARPTSFALKAPKTVRTGKRFTVTGSLPRSFANAAALLEVRVDNTWVPLQATSVSRKGRVSVRVQLSEPGRHAVRVRVGAGRSAAISKTVTVTAKGKSVTDETPLRMLAHYYSNQDAPITRRAGGRADPVDTTGAMAAAQAADDALSVKSVAEFVGDGVAGGVIGFGVTWVLSLIFPGQSAATGAQIQELEQQVQTGFNNVYADLTALQDSINAVEQQNSQIFSEAALAACNSSLSGLQADVQTIEVAYANYQDVLTADWGEGNLVYSGGTGNANAIGNYVFGVGSNATPSFGPGVNRVQVAVTNLTSQFTQSGPDNVISVCADAIAGYVIQQQAGQLSSPTDQLPIGVLDNAYAEIMQNLVGQYAAIINVGLALVGTGDLLAAATLVPTSDAGEPINSVPQFLSACQTLDLFSCQDTAEQITTGQQGVSQMWHAAGASWGQVTNGTLQSDLYAYAGQTTFSNGANAWVPDITSYRQGTFGVDTSPGAPLTSANVDTSSPVSGVSGLATSTWGPVTFSPASSAAFNGLIRTDQYSQPYPGAQGDILEACGGPQLTNCSDNTPIGTHLGKAGLSNGGAPVSSDDNLILYTAEDYTWDPVFSSASAGFGFMGKSEGTYWNQPAVFQLLVASFLDTGMLPNLGVSAIVNDPQTYNFQTGEGTIGNLTLGDVFPFSTNANDSSATPGDAVATSLTMQNYSNGYNLVAIPCSSWSPLGDYATDGGNWTVMNWLAPGNGATNNYGNGCGQTRYFPNGGAPISSGSTTQLTSSTPALEDFYTQPVLNAVLQTNDSQEPPFYVYSCGTAVTKGSPCTSTYWMGWDQLPGFVTAIDNEDELDQDPWTPVTPQEQQQYLWPVLPTDDTSLTTSCPSIPGGANVTNFSQGTTEIGLPQTCLSLFDEWLAMTAGQQIGPVFAQIDTQTGRPGGGYAATVSLVNEDSAAVTLSVGLSASSGATVAAGPSGPGVSSCTSTAKTPTGGYICQVTVPASSSTDVTVPLTYSSDDTSATLTVAAASKAQHYLAGASTTVTTAQAPNTMVPFGVTGLAAAFNQSTLNTTTGGGTVTLAWNAPYSQSPITSYVVTGTGPSGSTPIDDTIQPSAITVQSNGQLSTTVNISQGGPWTFTVAAVSSAGAGAPDTLSAYLGDAPPEPPRNVTGRELINGQVALAWQPGMASPPISSYTVTWWSGTSTTPPASAASLTPGPEWVTTGAGSSMVGTVSVSGTRYFIPPLPTTGPWTFQVTATNAMGTSAPSTTMVNMQGFVPSRPIGLDVEVTSLGAVNASWSASPFGVPVPTSYTIGLYAPTSCTQDDTCTTPLLQSATVDAASSRGPSEVIDLFSLGTNSTPGVYTVAVYATNALGDGATTRSTILITNAFIKRLTAVQDAVDTSKAKMAKSVEDLSKLECKRGLLSGSACTS